MKSGNCCAATRPPPQFPGCFGKGAGWVAPSRLLGARHPLQSHGKPCSLRQENCLWLRSGPAGAAPKPFPRPFCPFSEYFFFFPGSFQPHTVGSQLGRGPRCLPARQCRDVALLSDLPGRRTRPGAGICEDYPIPWAGGPGAPAGLHPQHSGAWGWDYLIY